MPHAALNGCSHPGCPELATIGQFCTAHSHVIKQESIRDPKGQRLYKTINWQHIRERQLAREPWCADCLKENRYTPATDCDHIKPWNGDPIKFFKGPLQSLCHSHHSQKTREENQLKGATFAN